MARPAYAIWIGYPAVCLFLGTVSGSVLWWGEAGMNALLAAALVLAWRQQSKAQDPRRGGSGAGGLRTSGPPRRGLWTLGVWFVVLTAGALHSPYAQRSWRLLVLFAAAAAVFRLVVGGAAHGRQLAQALAATATGVALWGLAAFALGVTPRVASPLGHHNYMAGFLLLHLPLTFGLSSGSIRGFAAAFHAPDGAQRDGEKTGGDARGPRADETSALQPNSPLGTHHSPLYGKPGQVATGRFLWIVAGLVQALAIVLTGSLAGVCVLAGLALFTAARLALGAGARPYRALAAMAVVLVLALGAVVVAGSHAGVLGVLHERAAAITARGRDPSLSLDNRLRFVRSGLAMFAARPLAGWGLGAVPLVSSLYREQIPGLSAAGEALPQLHDLPVNLLAETGLLGALCAALLVLLVLRGGLDPARLGLIAYGVFSLSDYQLDLPAIILPLAVMAGLACRVRGPWSEVRGPAAADHGPRTTDLRPPSRHVFLFFALVGVVLLARESVAHCLYSHGRLAAAARWDSSTGFYAFEQGAEAESQGRLEESRSAYLAAAARAPEVIPVAAQAGSALADAELWGRAMPLLERAAALDYYFTLAHFYLGQARLHAGDRAGAVEAFATSFLVRPATVFADVWLDSPEREVYGEALERAIDRLYDLAAFSPPDAPRRRFDELATFLVARRNRLPEGPYRLVLFDWLDRDPEVNHSLIVFRRDAPPKRVTPVALLSPTSGLQPPAGLGAIRGLPSVRAIDLLKAVGRE